MFSKVVIGLTYLKVKHNFPYIILLIEYILVPTTIKDPKIPRVKAVLPLWFNLLHELMQVGLTFLLLTRWLALNMECAAIYFLSSFDF